MKIKICGMTRQADIYLADSLGCDYCGFIFHPDSPRRVTPGQAASLHTGSMVRVGVFTIQTAEEIRDIMQVAKLDIAQLHGEQTPDNAKILNPSRIIRVIWPARYKNTSMLQKIMEKWENACAFFLIEAGTGGGGSGTLAPLDFLHKLQPPKPWFLAGGLNEHNLQERLLVGKPYALDFNSGLEDEPGHKNHDKIKKIFHLCRGN